MSDLVTVSQIRAYSGATIGHLPDDVVQECLDEAEAGLAADVRKPLDIIAAHPQASAVAVGDIKRRTANLLARRNSPEGVAGVGDTGIIPVPADDPGTSRAVLRIRRLLDIPRALAV